MRFLILLTSLMITFSSARAETFDSIAAVINHEAISCYDVQFDAEMMLGQLKAGGVKNIPPRSVINRRALDSKINKTLQLQEAAKLGLSIGPVELNNAIENIESKNNLLPGQLEKVLKQQGMDFGQYKENMGNQILISKLMNAAVRSKIQISEEAMREYYRKYIDNPEPRREVEVAQIFLGLPSEPSPEQLNLKRNKIDRILQQLQAGGSFSQMVALHSESSDREQNGVMGWFTPGSINQRFAQALELPVGAITDPIRSPSGFHLLTVLNERWKEAEAKGESYDEAHARHILLQIPTLSDDATRAKILHRAQNIAAEMKEATDEEFSVRAQEESQGPSSSRGGDLGWFKKGMMVPAFEEVAFSLNAGDTSGVVESNFGLHIIRVIAKRHVNPNSFEAHRGQIKQVLTNIEMQEQAPRWTSSLKLDASIDIRSCENNR